VSDDKSSEDELRQCPSCRMKVSVWATKCHHCSEELGRPRREEAKLTLKDLGGIQKTTYVPSGNVTGALESFRVEEVAAEISRSKGREKRGFLAGIFGGPAPVAPPVKSAVDELPELEEYSRNLAASILDDMPRPSSGGPRGGRANTGPGNASLQRLLFGGGAIAALIAIYFGGSFAWTHGSAWLEERNRAPEIHHENRAPEMIARGERSVDAFEEAMKAVRVKDNEENRAIANDVRARLLTDIDELMATNPWRSANHDTAYRYAQRAVNVDNHPSVAAKFDEVNREVAAYKFVLKAVDATGTEATFRPNHPDFAPELTVEVADRFMDRFIIQRISARSVDLVDDRAGGRKLSIGVNEGVKPRY